MFFARTSKGRVWHLYTNERQASGFCKVARIARIGTPQNWYPTTYTLCQRCLDNFPLRHIGYRCNECSSANLWPSHLKDGDYLVCDDCGHKTRMDDPLPEPADEKVVKRFVGYLSKAELPESELRKFRRSKGLTLKQLSKLSGVSDGSLSLIERHKTIPQPQTIAAIAQALGSTEAHIASMCATRDEYIETLEDRARRDAQKKAQGDEVYLFWSAVIQSAVQDGDWEWLRDMSRNSSGYAGGGYILEVMGIDIEFWRLVRSR